MKTQILLFSFLFLFSCNLQAQYQQCSAILQSSSERVDNWFNLTKPGFKSDQIMVPQKSNLFNQSMSVWKWDTILCYDTSSAQKPFQRVSRKYNSLGEALTNLFERSQGSFTWENYAREAFTYDSAGNRVALLQDIWQNNTWVNFMKQEFAYNANGDQVDWKRYGWDSSAWANYWHYSWHFDTNGLNDTSIYQEGQDSIWVNNYLWITSYDNNGYMTSILTNTWINNGWEVTNLDTYTNDSNGNILTLLRQNWENLSWVNNSFYTYTWDTVGNRISTLIQEWQNSTWANLQFNYYLYDSQGNRIMRLIQHWLSGSWGNSYRVLYSYDSNNNMLSETFQDWDNSSWQNGETQQYTYDSWGNSLTGKYLWWYQNFWQPYDGSLYVFADHQQDIVLQGIYRYSAVIDSILVFMEPARSPLQVTLFPNPAHSTMYISSRTESTYRYGSLTMYDLRGQLVLSKQIVNETTGIDISTLKPGVYFVRFSDDHITRVIKFVKV